MAFSISFNKIPLFSKYCDIIPQSPTHKNSVFIPILGPMSKRQVALATGDMRPEIDEYPEGIISGEWTENFSLLSYDDLLAYFESQIKTTKKVPFFYLSDQKV